MDRRFNSDELVTLSIDDILHLNNAKVLVNNNEIIKACEAEVTKAVATVAALNGDQEAIAALPEDLLDYTKESPWRMHYFAVGAAAAAMEVGHYLGVFDDRQIDLIQEAMTQLMEGKNDPGR